MRQTCPQINLHSQPLRLFFKIRLHGSGGFHSHPADTGLSEIAEICARARPDFQHHAGELGEEPLFVVGRELLVPPVATRESPCKNPLAECGASDPVHAVSLSTLGTTSQALASDSDSSFTGWRTSLRRHKRVHLVEAGTISVQRGREKVAYAPHLRTPG